LVFDVGTDETDGCLPAVPVGNPEHFVLSCFVCTLYTSLHQTSQLGIFWAGGGAMWHLHVLRERVSVYETVLGMG